MAEETTSWLGRLLKSHRKRVANRSKAVGDINARLDEELNKPHPDFEKIQQIANESPSAQQTVEDRIRKERTAAANGRYSPLLKALTSTAGVAASIGQINRANMMRQGLVQPSIPNAPAVDPGLQQQIFAAQRGSFDAGRAVNSANIGINDAYNQAVQEASNTSGGQAGIRSALINRANLNKMRANAALLPEIDAIRAREEGRADSLVGTRANLAQENYGNQLRAAQMALEQYNNNARAIGNLGAIGHENLFGQLQGLSDTLIPAVGSFSNPYSNRRLYGNNYERAHSDRIGEYDHYLNDQNKKFKFPLNDNNGGSYYPPGWSGMGNLLPS